MVITDCDKNKDDIAIHGNTNNKEANESINNNNTCRVKTKAWRKGACLVTGHSMLGHKDETRMSRKIKGSIFCCSKNRRHVSVTCAIAREKCRITLYFMLDYEASAIFKKILKVKEFIKLWVPNCKVIISRPIKRHGNGNASRVIKEVIAQFQKLTIDMVGNENIEKKRLGKRRFHLNGFGLKKFAQNLIAGIRELWIIKKSFCDDISQKTNQLKECKLYHNSAVINTKNNTFSEEHDLLCTSSKQKNDCYYKEGKIKLDMDGLNINNLQNKIISLTEIIAKVPLDVFCVDETKLEYSFPNSQFILKNFQFPPFRRDRNSTGGGKLFT